VRKKYRGFGKYRIKFVLKENIFYDIELRGKAYKR